MKVKDILISLQVIQKISSEEFPVAKSLEILEFMDKVKEITMRLNEINADDKDKKKELLEEEIDLYLPEIEISSIKKEYSAKELALLRNLTQK